jgi:hypothetical protein
MLEIRCPMVWGTSLDMTGLTRPRVSLLPKAPQTPSSQDYLIFSICPGYKDLRTRVLKTTTVPSMEQAP